MRETITAPTNTIGIITLVNVHLEFACLFRGYPLRIFNAILELLVGLIIISIQSIFGASFLLRFGGCRIGFVLIFWVMRAKVV
jgi:hypothetical protein